MDLQNVKMASLDVGLSVSQDVNDFQETAWKRIYNSHYSNGVPAMFTSYCCPAES